MGRSAVGLWLPEKHEALDAAPWLEHFCDLEARSDGSIDVCVRNPSAVGLPYLQQAEGRFNLGPEAIDDGEQAAFPGLDTPPAAELVVFAYCSGPQEHRLLGHLALFLAERFGALIDFGGMLGYRYAGHCRTVEEKAARLAESRALVASLPGRVLEMPFEIEDGLYGYSHVGDREFLAAWLGHPDFRLI
nr:DUF6368 family protein [Streptomyces sp. NBC_00899]